jgi:hypothetical protein
MIADNTILLRQANCRAMTSTNPTKTQKSLESLRKWTEENRMLIKEEKTTVLKFIYDGTLTKMDQFICGSGVLEIVTHSN